MDKARGIIRARRAAAGTLYSALGQVGRDFTEASLAECWLREAKNSDDILPFGWYQPPPDGISVLVGQPPSFDRLQFGSLREQINWPSASVRYDNSSVLYPYLSAVDRRTGMIGDFVGTFYAGSDREVRSWIAAVYDVTLRIANFAAVGQQISEVYEFARTELESLGGHNNTLSMSGGTDVGADIGHTVPGYDDIEVPWHRPGASVSDVVHEVAATRRFISSANDARINKETAFTIEPQILQPGLPMASFHVIVAFVGQEKYVVEEFDQLFDFFGMISWIR
jgi:hypothetical protein